MAKNYETEIREMYGKSYLKVFLKDLDIIPDLQSSLSLLPSVAKVSITESQSAYTLPKNLTVIAKRPFSIEETVSQV